jgi:hypothetical protein
MNFLYFDGLVFNWFWLCALFGEWYDDEECEDDATNEDEE